MRIKSIFNLLVMAIIITSLSSCAGSGGFLGLGAVHAKKIGEFQPVYDLISAIAFDSKGEKIALGYENGTVCLLDPVSGEKIFEVNPFEEYRKYMMVSPDGRLLVAQAGKEHRLEIVSVETGETLHNLGTESCGRAVFCFSDNGKFLVTGDQYNRFEVWSTDSGELHSNISLDQEDNREFRTGRPYFTYITDDGARLFVTLQKQNPTINPHNPYESTTIVFNVKDGGIINKFDISSKISIDYTGKYMLGVYGNTEYGNYHLVNVDTGEIILKLPENDNEVVLTPVISKDGRYLFYISGGSKTRHQLNDGHYGSLTILDLKTGKSSSAFNEQVVSFFLSKDCKTIFCHLAGREKNTALCKLDGLNITPTYFDLHLPMSSSINSFSNDCRFFACMDRDEMEFDASIGSFIPMINSSTLKIYETKTGKLLSETHLDQFFYNNFIFSSDNKYIINNPGNFQADFWDKTFVFPVENPSQYFEYDNLGAFTQMLAFSSDNTKILAVGSDYTRRILSATDGSTIKTEKIYYSSYARDNFDTGGEMLAMKASDDTVDLLSLETLELVKTLKIEGSIQAIQLSPDDRTLYCFHGGRPACAPALSGKVCSWSVETGENTGTIWSDFGAYFTFVLSPDGQTIYTTGHHCNFRWKDIKTGKERIGEETTEESALIASPDGRFIVRGGWIPTSFYRADNLKHVELKGFYPADVRENEFESPECEYLHIAVFNPVNGNYVIGMDCKKLQIWELN